MKFLPCRRWYSRRRGGTVSSNHLDHWRLWGRPELRSRFQLWHSNFVTRTHNNCPQPPVQPRSIVSFKFQRLGFHVHDEINQPYQLLVRVIQDMIHHADCQIPLPIHTRHHEVSGHRSPKSRSNSHSIGPFVFDQDANPPCLSHAFNGEKMSGWSPRIKTQTFYSLHVD
jgi:hypothetical protein